MTSEQVPDADSYELDSIKRRVEARKVARAAELLKKEAEDELKRHLMARALRAKNRPAPVVDPPLWTRLYSRFLSIVKSKALHNVLSGSSLAIMVGVLGVFTYNFISERTAAAFRDHCLENHLKYASGSRMYCYDDRRFAHVIMDTGVSGRLIADWGVNERQLRLAEKVAEHAAGPVYKPAAGFAAKPVTGRASALAVGLSAGKVGTVADLAAQIMSN